MGDTVSKFYDEDLNEDELKQEYLKLNSHCKFKTAEELKEKVEEYFVVCYQNQRPYTISGLALWLGLSTQTLRNYEKNFGDTEYSDIIEIAKQRVEEYAEKSLYESGKTAGAKFVLENNFRWSNKQDVNLSGEVNQIVKLEDVL